MRKCPFCAEQIQDEALKCKHCGSDLTKAAEIQGGQVSGTSGRPKGDFAKLIGTGCLVFVVLSVIGVIVMLNGDRATGSAPAPAQPPALGQVSQGQAELAEVVQLATLLGEYRDNEVRADQKFKGRVVEISGTVADAKKDILGEIYVMIGTSAELEIPQVQCMFPKTQAQVVAKLSRGDRVTVRGTVSGLVFNVILRECMLKQDQRR